MRQHVYLCTQKSVEPDYWKSEGCIRSPHSKKQWPEDEDEKPTEMEYRIPDATQSGGDAKKRLAMFNGAVSKNPRGIFHYLSANTFIPDIPRSISWISAQLSFAGGLFATWVEFDVGGEREQGDNS
ncbi:MAG: hypothetical protein H7A43_11865 [Verrucomicrobia bacterium]|nr:hypothetical protein [Verrucomicrobiota bacterium]